MLNIETRTSPAQDAAIKEIAATERIHSLRHNLDGLWVNLETTAGDGDWIISIDRAGNIERTQ